MYSRSNGYKAGGKMCDGHLIAYGSKRIVCCLFGFSVTKPREVLLNGLSVLEYFFVFFAVSGNSCTCIIGNIKIFRTAITFTGIERWAIGGTNFAVFFGEFFACLYWASEFDSTAITFCPSAN